MSPEAVLGFLLLFATFAVPPGTWAVLTYNRLIRLRQHCRESWSAVETELRRRYDLIPNLVRTVEGYARHERTVLRGLAESRTRAIASEGSPGTQAVDEHVLVGCLREFVAVAEAYPELRADDHFRALKRQLSNTEDRIQAARRFYNANVRDLNTAVASFPSNLAAWAFGIRAEEYFDT